MSKYEVISGPYFPVFSPNTGKYGPEITSYLDTFYAVINVRAMAKCHMKKGIYIEDKAKIFSKAFYSARNEATISNTFHSKSNLKQIVKPNKQKRGQA